MKVKVFKRLDGGVTIKHLDIKYQLLGESETDFHERMVRNLRFAPHIIGAEEILMDETDLPVYDSKTRNKWRLHQNKGSVIVDNSVILPEEVRQGFLVSAKAKLKNGAPLTDDEIDAMFKRI